MYFLNSNTRVMIPDNDDGSGSGMWLTGMGVYMGVL